MDREVDFVQLELMSSAFLFVFAWRMRAIARAGPQYGQQNGQQAYAAGLAASYVQQQPGWQTHPGHAR